MLKIITLSCMFLFYSAHQYTMGDSLAAVNLMLKLPEDLQKIVLSHVEDFVEIKYDTSQKLYNKKKPLYDNNFIKNPGIDYDKTITLPTEYTQIYKDYLILNRIRHQYRGDTRSDSYYGPLDKNYYDEKIPLIENYSFISEPSLEALSVQIINQKTYVVCYCSKEAIDGCYHRFFLHKLYPNKSFIRPPEFLQTDSACTIAKELNIQEYEKIKINNALKHMLLVSDEDYEQYNDYVDYRDATINNNHLLNHFTDLAHLCTQKLRSKNSNQLTIDRACNILKLFHKEIFKAEHQRLKTMPSQLNLITQMRFELIKKITESDDALSFLEDTTIFPKTVKGSAAIENLIDIIKIKKDPDTSRLCPDLNDLIATKLDVSNANWQKADALYRFCGIAQQIIYNLDLSFKLTSKYDLSEYKNVLQTILDYNLSKESNFTEGDHALLRVLKHTINSNLATLDSVYNSIK